MSEPYLRGARAIAQELKRLGIIADDDPNAEDKVYYLNRSKKLPLDRFGRELISTPTKIKQIINRVSNR